MKYNINEVESTVGRHIIIKDLISSILNVVDHPNQLVEETSYCARQTRKCGKSVARQKQRVLYYKMIQQNAFDKLVHISGLILLLATSLLKTRLEAAIILKERDVYRSKWQDVATLEKHKRTSMKLTLLK